MHIPIVFENDDFVVCNKPVGVGMHSDTVAMGVVEQCKHQLGIKQLYLTHRLDTPTSGCLLLAKNKRTASEIGKAFENKEVNKLYLALSDQKPKKKQGQVKGDMKPSRDGNYKLLKSSQNPAITRFKSFLFAPKIRLFVCKPITGKTHQIRVALKALSAPIIGDERYKGSAADRLYLHSYMIQFSLNQQLYSITCMPNEGEFFHQYALQNVFESNINPEDITW
jgi:tRNA pseudouridine32 synthase/23S rRNA pseudouridine746 synthase